MSLAPSSVKKIASLARLAVSDKEVGSLVKDLTRILDLVEEMNQVDTQKVTPLAHPYEETQPLREDLITEPNQRDDFQQLAPQTQAGLYIVPQVIDDE